MLQGNIGVEQLTLSNESVPSFFNSHCYPISEASPTYDFLPFLVAQLLQVSSATQVLGFQSKSLSLKRRKLYKKMIYCPIVNNHIDFLHKILYRLFSTKHGFTEKSHLICYLLLLAGYIIQGICSFQKTNIPPATQKKQT